MKILFLAPLPPPINGQSLASKILYDFLKDDHQVILINLKRRKNKGILNEIKRFKEIIFLSFKVYKYSRKSDLIYFTISESTKGNLKDILFFILMWPALSKTILHLHGGAGMKKILNKKNTIFFSINYYFLKKINKVIVLSESLKSIYKDILPEKNLAIVENFSEDLFFSNLDSIEKKFTNNDKLKCLFLSNLLPGKGINELLDAYKLLDSDLQSNIILNIAGATEDKKITEKILEMEYLFPNFKYHNVVQGLTKKNLLEETHLFILPTYYEYEGQPISILEAYASGSAVATTNHSGIPDIFTGGENGYLIIGKSHESILQLFHLAYNDLHNGSLIRYAFYNYNIASRKYRMKDYVNRFFNLFKMYDFSPENRRVLK